MFGKLMLRMAGVHRRANGVVANNAKAYRFPDGTDASKATENVNPGDPSWAILIWRNSSRTTSSALPRWWPA